ncbi:UNVERIFIED_CONTAM: hypothetical protein K2H54_060977 [Gekko kuhli]
MIHEDFNISLLAPCFSLGMQELSRDQKNLFETARRVTLAHVTAAVQKLPISHQVFQPLQPTETSVYWNKLNDIFGDTGLYQSTMVLSRALSQFLVLLAKVPVSLRIPHDKENDILKFVVMSVEILSWHLVHEHIPLSIDIQAVLDCCCLMLQQTNLWNLLASALYMTHACSLINCIRFIIEAADGIKHHLSTLGIDSSTVKVNGTSNTKICIRLWTVILQMSCIDSSMFCIDPCKKEER